MLNLTVLRVVTLAALGAAVWTIDHMRGEAARQADRIDTLERDASRDRQLIDDQARALAGQQDLQAALAAISASTRKTEQALARQAAQLARDLEELKRTDETVQPYLRGLVPVAVGLRYQRPETVDPLAYRAGPGLRPGAVSAVGARPAGDQ